jgi:uncharacterized protein (TIGR02118 family)
MALGDDREAALESGRRLAAEGKAASVVVHLALEGQERHFVAALRAVGPVDELARGVEEAGTRGIWDTEFRRVKAHGRATQPGVPTPGLGLLFGIWRLPKLSREEFDRYWRDHHAPLALRHHVGMWDYVQCSFRASRAPQGADYDGVAICQFPSLRDLEERFYDGPEGERAIAEDVIRFGDPTRLHRVRMIEHILR